MADRPRLSQALVLLGTIACIGLSFLFLPSSASIRPWKGARLIAVDASRPEEGVLAALAKQGLTKIVSKFSQRASFSDFDAWESVALSELDLRLIPADPRRDSYIEGLKGYFTAVSGNRTFNLFYLLDLGITRSRLEGKLSKALGSAGDWMLVESGSKRGAMEGCIAWCLLLIVLVATTPKRIRRACVSLCAWFGIFLSSSWLFMLACLPAIILAYCLLASARSYPYEKRYTIGFCFQLLKNEIGLSLSICLLLSSGFAFILYPISYAFALGSMALICLSARWHEKEKTARALHRVFQPLPLRKGATASFGKKQGATAIPYFCLAAGLIAVAAIIAPSSGNASRNWKGLLSFPYPHGYTNSAASGTKYPNYRDYLEHLNYQAKFLEADLAAGPSTRTFAGYSQKADGSLIQTGAQAIRLDASEGRSGTGMESILMKAGERERIVMDAWDGEGSAGSTISWPFPFILGGMALGLASFYIRKIFGRLRETGAQIDAAPVMTVSGRRKGAQ